MRRRPVTFTQAPDGSLEVEPPAAPPQRHQVRELAPLLEQIGAVVGVALVGWQLLEQLERRVSRRRYLVHR